MALSPKQQAFIEHYLTTWNGAEAARRAGYKTKPNVQGARMLANASIQAAIQDRLATLKMDADEVLVRITDHARGTMADFFTIGEEEIMIERRQRGDIIETETVRRKVARLDLEKAANANKLHLIKSYSLTDKGQRIELYDAQVALRDQMKILGLGKDDGGILKYIDLSKLNQDQLQRITNGEDILAVLLDKPETASGGGAGVAEARPE